MFICLIIIVILSMLKRFLVKKAESSSEKVYTVNKKLFKFELLGVQLWMNSGFIICCEEESFDVLRLCITHKFWA